MHQTFYSNLFWRSVLYQKYKKHLSILQNENEVAPEEKPVVLEESIPSVENQDAADLNVTSNNIEKEDTPETVDDKAEEAEVVATPATPATPNLNKTTEEAELPSFREFTQKALEEEERKREEKEKEKKKNLNR